MEPCKFCEAEYRGVKLHELTCWFNPNRRADFGLVSINRKIWACCIRCRKELTAANIQKHITACLKDRTSICPQCGDRFENKWNSATCSYSCANRYFHKGNRVHNLTDAYLMKKNRYVDLCFRYHEKKCVVCPEILIIEVHHYSDNHDDHRPVNLVPLCPTHHKYMHSGHRHLIEKQVDEYMKDFITKYGM